MEWFNRKTSIAGIQIPNWVTLVLGAIIIIVVAYGQMGIVEKYQDNPPAGRGLRIF